MAMSREPSIFPLLMFATPDSFLEPHFGAIEQAHPRMSRLGAMPCNRSGKQLNDTLERCTRSYEILFFALCRVFHSL